MKKQIIFSSLSKQLLMPVLLLFAGVLVSAEMKAQSKPSALLSGNGVLQLPTNVALTDSYEFSTASFGFQNETQAVQFFKLKSESDFFFRVRLNEQKAYVYLNKQAHPSWTLTEWNNLLNTKTTASPLLN